MYVVILAVYIPTSSPNQLAKYEARRLSSESESVIFYGDMNAHSRQLGPVTQNLAGTDIDALTLPRGPSSFFRADTGSAFTRPYPAIQGGSVIDFIFDAHADLTEGRCYDLADWTSDHRPISCCVVPQAHCNADSISVWKTLKTRISEHSTFHQFRRRNLPLKAASVTCPYDHLHPILSMRSSPSLMLWNLT